MSIEVRNISKRFGTYTALAGVNLNVGTGRLTALLGPSGSGKTTLLRIIAGLEYPDASADPEAGRVLFHGADVSLVPAGRRGVGFVFQHYALFKHMTVSENIAFGLKVRPRRERSSVTAIAERVQAQQLMRRAMFQLDQAPEFVVGQNHYGAKLADTRERGKSFRRARPCRNGGQPATIRRVGFIWFDWVGFTRIWSGVTPVARAGRDVGLSDFEL